MPRNVFVISRNSSVLDSVKKAFARFRVISVPISDVQDLSLKLQNPDLIVLDGCGGFSSEQLNTALVWSNSQKKIGGAAVSLLVKEYSILTGGFDFVMPIDAIETSQWRNE